MPIDHAHICNELSNVAHSTWGKHLDSLSTIQKRSITKIKQILALDVWLTWFALIYQKWKRFFGLWLMRLYTCLNLFICWCKKRTYYIMSISDRMQNLNNTIRITLFSLNIIAKIASLTRVYTTNLVISTWGNNTNGYGYYMWYYHSALVYNNTSTHGGFMRGNTVAPPSFRIKY